MFSNQSQVDETVKQMVSIMFKQFWDLEQRKSRCRSEANFKRLVPTKEELLQINVVKNEPLKQSYSSSRVFDAFRNVNRGTVAKHDKMVKHQELIQSHYRNRYIDLSMDQPV